MSGVFEGLRVIDLSWGIAGPMTTMLLADNGAQVTRLELEGIDPFRAQTGYRVWHRGKRSVSCDLDSDEGRRLALDLAGTADLVLESFSPGTTARMGIDHDACSAHNPGLITCSITGYGPLARTAPIDRGYDGLVAARTGLLFDQKGRRGTAMEYINGRPGPLPEFGASRGPRSWRRSGRADLPADPLAERRRDLLRHARDRRRTAGSRGDRCGSARGDVAAAGRTGRRVPQLAAGREP